MLRMEQVHVIRHKVLREGQSIRQVAREMGVSRNTIEEVSARGRSRYGERRARDAAGVGTGEAAAGRAAGGVGAADDGQAAADRHAAATAVGGRGPAIGTTLIRQYLREAAAPASGSLHSVDSPAGRGGAGRFLRGDGGGGRPVGQGVGVSAAPDVLGARVRLALQRCDQLAFLDGHVRAFAYLGGVVHAAAVYDNLKPAVRRIVGAQRVLSERFLSVGQPLSV